jgi:hypothetical protein
MQGVVLHVMEQALGDLLPMARLVWESVRRVRRGAPAGGVHYESATLAQAHLRRLEKGMGRLMCFTAFRTFAAEVPGRVMCGSGRGRGEVLFEVPGGLIHRLLLRTSRGFAARCTTGVVMPLTPLRVRGVASEDGRMVVRLGARTEGACGPGNGLAGRGGARESWVSRVNRQSCIGSGHLVGGRAREWPLRRLR